MTAGDCPAHPGPVAHAPLTVMYPEADVPVLQMSLPTLEPDRLPARGCGRCASRAR